MAATGTLTRPGEQIAVSRPIPGMQNETRNQSQNDPPLRLPTYPPAMPNHIRMTTNCQPAIGGSPNDSFQGPENRSDSRDGDQDPEDRQDGVDQ